ncbi:MAG: RHS repeat-associated core domain-containing protein [Candidatus Electrothrix sp. LOE2]|nr:RHS repeat-associated core domain-containing protein [Candidatus Electrothrix sp. LOE2]
MNGKPASFVFDSRNRLRQVGSTVYTYDAENQRIAAADGGATTQYVVNPNAPLSQVLVREDQAGEKTYYVYGIGLIGQEKNGAYRSFHYDFRGSTVAMTDEVGNITHQYAYTAYGTVKAVQEEDFNPFRYVGQYGVMYEGNGLYYMRARYYQPELRRFLGEDPIWNKNLFAYVEGNPLVNIDPTGLLFTRSYGPGYDRTLFQSERSVHGNSCGAASIIEMVSHVRNVCIRMETEIDALYEAGAGRLRNFQYSYYPQMRSRLDHYQIPYEWRSFGSSDPLYEERIARSIRNDLRSGQRLIINPTWNLAPGATAHFYNVHQGTFAYNDDNSINLDESTLISSDSLTGDDWIELNLGETIRSMHAHASDCKENVHYISVVP